MSGEFWNLFLTPTKLLKLNIICIRTILRSTGTESVYVTFPYPCTGTEIVRMTGKVEKRVDGYGLISIFWYGNGYGNGSIFKKLVRIMYG